MTIPNSPAAAGPYATDGYTTTFPFEYKSFGVGYHAVVKDTSGVLTSLVYGTDFAVTQNADQDVSPGGTVLISPALPAGSLLSIYSNVPYEQPTQLPTGGRFFAAAIMDALDRIVTLVKQGTLSTSGGTLLPSDRSLRVQTGETINELPLAAGRLNKLLGFDNSGNVTVVDNTLGGTLTGTLTVTTSAGTTPIQTTNGAVNAFVGGGDGSTFAAFGTTSNVPLQLYNNGSSKLQLRTDGRVDLVGHLVQDLGSDTSYLTHVFRNRFASASSHVIGAILWDAYRDVANPSYAAGVWCEAAGAAGNTGDLVFGAMENGGAGLPTERLRISSDGTTTVKRLAVASPSNFRAVSSATRSSGFGEAVTYSVESYDSGSNFNPTTGRFTAPELGMYSFSFSVASNSAAGSIVTGFLRVDGVATNYFPVSASTSAVGDGTTSCGSGTLYLSAGSYVSVFMSVAGGAACLVDQFSGVRLT